MAIALLMPGTSQADLRASLEQARADEGPLDRDLRYWVCRALHVDVPFASAADAAQAIDAIVVEHNVKKGFNPELAEVLEGGTASLDGGTASVELGAGTNDEREDAPGAAGAAPATVEELLFEFEARANATAAIANGLPPAMPANSAASGSALDVDEPAAAAQSEHMAARGFGALAAWVEPRQPKRVVVAGCIAAVCMSAVAFKHGPLDAPGTECAGHHSGGCGS